MLNSGIRIAIFSVLCLTPWANAEIVTSRSLAVTEVEILSRFSFEDVLDQLIRENGTEDLQTGRELWTQWLATNGNCDDFNGYPISCRGGELETDADPFTIDNFNYQAVGLFNRFDLASADGSDCGEYRIVFAREHNDFAQEKTLIFEARLSNPQPEAGLAGCSDIAQFWASLTNMDANEARADALESFYFSGIAGIKPVLHPDHFQRLDGSGQVRTNSFLENTEWSMREYGIRRDCSIDCQLVFKQMPTKENPFLALLDDTAFQDWLIDTIAIPGEGLLANSVNELTFPVPEVFNSGESLSPESRVRPLFIPNIADNMPAVLSERIADKLAVLGSSISAEQLINRANSLTCNGCHHTSSPSFSGNNDDLGFAATFPDVDRFRHVQLSVDTIDAPNGPRYKMSDALKIEFLPYRKQVFEEYLATLSPLSASIQIESQWSDGYCANVTIINTGSESVNWSAHIDLHGSSFASAWNALTSVQGDVLTASGEPWNATVASGKDVSFGFCAAINTDNWMPEVISTDAT